MQLIYLNLQLIIVIHVKKHKVRPNLKNMFIENKDSWYL